MLNVKAMEKLLSRLDARTPVMSQICFLSFGFFRGFLFKHRARKKNEMQCAGLLDVAVHEEAPRVLLDLLRRLAAAL